MQEMTRRVYSEAYCLFELEITKNQSILIINRSELVTVIC